MTLIPSMKPPPSGLNFNCMTNGELNLLKYIDKEMFRFIRLMNGANVGVSSIGIIARERFEKLRLKRNKILKKYNID